MFFSYYHQSKDIRLDRPESKANIYNSVYITYEENDKRLDKYFGSIVS
jgi:hypothetical protein